MSKHPIIYSGLLWGSATPFFSARLFGVNPPRHRIAGWCGFADTGSFKSTHGLDYGVADEDFTDDGEAIAWLLDGEKGGAK